MLKTKFGKAIAEEANPNEIVSIPGLKNRPTKEISLKNLAHIIEARLQEIVELVHAEIITSGYENKLSGGIILTGGGALMSCIKQLVEYMTGLDARIGYPNEHLGKSKIDAVKSPMYATTLGLVLSGFKALDERENRYNETKGSNDHSNKYKGDKKLQGLNFFNNIIEKTKGLLIDDVDDRQDY